MATPSVTEQLANISQYLWTDRIAKNNAFFNGNNNLNDGRDVVLLVQNAALSYGIANNLSGVQGVANNVYTLCGAELAQAQEVYSNGSSGVVPSPSGSGSYQPAFIDYTVTGLNNPNTTVTELQNDDWIGLMGLTEFTMNNQVFQLNVNFLFNSVSGTINFDLSPNNIYYPQNGDVITATGLFKIVTP